MQPKTEKSVANSHRRGKLITTNYKISGLTVFGRCPSTSPPRTPLKILRSHTLTLKFLFRTTGPRWLHKNFEGGPGGRGWIFKNNQSYKNPMVVIIFLSRWLFAKKKFARYCLCIFTQKKFNLEKSGSMFFQKNSSPRSANCSISSQIVFCKSFQRFLKMVHAVLKFWMIQQIRFFYFETW